jgi:RHS repeat-associated protein
VATPNADVDGDGQAFTLNLRFPGQYFDEETGTHYNYFRDYDPGVGRYLQSDPIGVMRDYSLLSLDLKDNLNIETPDNINKLNHLYGYSEQKPINYIDPMGLRPIGDGSGPSARTECTLQCIDNYLISWASGAAVGWVYGAAGGPASLVTALGGMVGRAMNTTVVSACIHSCTDDGDSCE